MDKYQYTSVNNTGSRRLFQQQKAALLEKGWQVEEEDHAHVLLKKLKRTKPPKRTAKAEVFAKSSEKSKEKGQKVEKSSGSDDKKESE